jgi:hypothetical protein
MSTMPEIDKLNDETTLRILAHLTAELREELSDEDRNAVKTAEDARHALTAVLAHGANAPALDPEKLLLDEATARGHARDVLQALLEDEDVRPRVEALLAAPPDVEQRSVEALLATAVILGCLVTWLQTKFKITVTYKEGKTEVQAELEKPTANKETIATTLRALVGLPKAK